MGDYRIFETDQFLNDLERISPARRDKLAMKLRSFVYPQLREQPYFGSNIRMLKGLKPDTWRCRIGPYRFFHLIDDKERSVSMVAADTRQRSY